MRYIPLRSPDSQFKSRPVLSTLIQQSPGRALTLADMRMRARLLDRLEDVAPEADHILLEEDEWKELQACANSFPWSVFHRDLLQVLEDIDGAGEPPVILHAVNS